MYCAAHLPSFSVEAPAEKTLPFLDLCALGDLSNVLSGITDSADPRSSEGNYCLSGEVIGFGT